MNLANDLIKEINEMAFSRSSWVDRIRDKFLGGALGEYAKLTFARKTGIPDYWSDEVKELLSHIKEMRSTKTKTKSKFDREKALKEAIKEASIFQDQVTSARNEMTKKFPEKTRELLKLHLKSKDLMIEMLKEFKLD